MDKLYCSFCQEDKPEDEVRTCDKCGDPVCADCMPYDEKCDCGGSF